MVRIYSTSLHVKLISGTSASWNDLTVTFSGAQAAARRCTVILNAYMVFGVGSETYLQTLKLPVSSEFECTIY